MSISHVVAATSSGHKFLELGKLFPGINLMRIDMIPPEETGATFLENALLKARIYHLACGKPVLADDSGLCVNALGGAPGLYSARWGAEIHGRPMNDGEKNQHLLSLLDKEADRSAYYICAMVFLEEPERFSAVQAVWHGSILHEQRGTGGFGFDPVFQPEGLQVSSAELAPEEKNRLSHRGQAAFMLGKIFDNSRERL